MINFYLFTSCLAQTQPVSLFLAMKPGPMDKKNHDNTDAPELTGFRKEIDAIDDEIIRLLIKRTSVVSNVGEFKRKHHPGQCPIRPGREARMLRRVMEKIAPSPFSPAAVAAMWRLLISGSTCVEYPLQVSVFTPEQDDEL